LQPASDTEPVIWRFDDAAQALFVEWLVPFETEIRGDDLHPAMESRTLSKYRKLIPALALVFALIDTPDSGGVIHEGELSWPGAGLGRLLCAPMPNGCMRQR
jgi:putative DNA primase/helicase